MKTRTQMLCGHVLKKKEKKTWICYHLPWINSNSSGECLVVTPPLPGTDFLFAAAARLPFAQLMEIGWGVMMHRRLDVL